MSHVNDLLSWHWFFECLIQEGLAGIRAFDGDRSQIPQPSSGRLWGFVKMGDPEVTMAFNTQLF